MPSLTCISFEIGPIPDMQFIESLYRIAFFETSTTCMCIYNRKSATLGEQDKINDNVLLAIIAQCTPR